MKHSLFSLAILTLALVGCSPGYEVKDGAYPVRPKELSDCHIVQLTSTNGGHLTVVRCPNSTTTTKSGKRQVTTTETDSIMVNAGECRRK